jgi:hypothetical protein
MFCWDKTKKILIISVFLFGSPDRNRTCIKSLGNFYFYPATGINRRLKRKSIS